MMRRRDDDEKEERCTAGEHLNVIDVSRMLATCPDIRTAPRIQTLHEEEDLIRRPETRTKIIQCIYTAPIFCVLVFIYVFI